MNWAYQLKPRANELLSGFLCRVAWAHGASPFGFYNLHLEDKSFWARDIDRGVAGKHTRLLAQLAGVSPVALEALTLTDWRRTLSPPRYRTDRPSAVTPWINVVGVFHRTRVLHGLQFCPECLAQTGTIDRRWRLSFVVICEEHRRPLSDACPQCDSPFIPHRAMSRAHRCHQCQRRLDQVQGGDFRAVGSTDAALRFQRRMLAMGCDAEDARKRIHPEGVAGIRELVSVVFGCHIAPTALAYLGVDAGSSWASDRTEMSRLARRALVGRACELLLSEWPASFRDISQKVQLTQRAFARMGGLPGWLEVEVKHLSPGFKRSRKARRASIAVRIAALEQSRPAHWRSLRAKLMLGSAKVRP